MKLTGSRFVPLALAGAAGLSCGRPERPVDAPAVVEVTAAYDAQTNEHRFLTDVEQILPGWTTFRLVNASPDLHFLLLYRLPAGRTVEDSRAEVVPVFQDAMDLIVAGRPEEGFARLDDLPAWLEEVRFMGGPGLVAPGRTAEATVELEPGSYVMECYVKTAEGKFHSALGMIRGLTVTGERSPATAPADPDLEMTLTNQGFGVRGDAVPGRQVVAVHFAEENPPFLGNDVHLLRLDEGTQAGEAAAWMDWSRPEGLVSDAASVRRLRFQGGTHEMPFGSTAYFAVELTPGRYAWISERPAAEPLYEEFNVPAP